MDKNLQEAFLSLVRLGIGYKTSFPSEAVDWTAMKALAEQQGLSAIVLDGIEELSSNQRPQQVFLLNWIGEVLQGYEYRYETCKKTIAEMANFYSNHGYKMMVLKGYACSIDWPKPNHRPCGDIDIWLFGKQKGADELLVREKGIKVDGSHHHHTVFNWGEFSVENHYDFVNVHHHRSNIELDKELKRLGENDSYYVNVLGEKVFVPSPNLHALFLLRHAMNHFASSEISLRQLLDWAFHVKTHRREIDWTWLEATLDSFGVTQLFHIFNAICIEDLGFDSSLFPEPIHDPVQKERILKDILSPSFYGEEPQKLLKRIVFKYRRWKSNGWKHRLCYKESMWSAFWSGVWSHLLKPSSI